jgi:hypothetical protein
MPAGHNDWLCCCHCRCHLPKFVTPLLPFLCANRNTMCVSRAVCKVHTHTPTHTYTHTHVCVHKCIQTFCFMPQVVVYSSSEDVCILVIMHRCVLEDCMMIDCIRIFIWHGGIAQMGCYSTVLAAIQFRRFLLWRKSLIVSSDNFSLVTF